MKDIEDLFKTDSEEILGYVQTILGATFSLRYRIRL